MRKRMAVHRRQRFVGFPIEVQLGLAIVDHCLGEFELSFFMGSYRESIVHDEGCTLQSQRSSYVSDMLMSLLTFLLDR
jgi:hypothetical protein